mmetsp:Transcript_31080/g.46905  ORF Transcript_31080/g.46905 Transcript_31080/m.46905 type:complete len:88 (+) Transcript_31080:2-265(+)
MPNRKCIVSVTSSNIHKCLHRFFQKHSSIISALVFRSEGKAIARAAGEAAAAAAAATTGRARANCRRQVTAADRTWKPAAKPADPKQ